MRKYLVQAANAAIKKKGSFYQAKHRRLVYQLGSHNKATVAIANRIARVLYHLIKTPGLCYKDLGAMRADDKDLRIRRALSQLKSLGVEVSYHTHQKIVAKREVTVSL